MPQFLFIELPSFRIKDSSNHTVSLSKKHLGRMLSLFQQVRGCLETSTYADLLASLLFSGGETDLWTTVHTPPGLHAEENLLLAYFQSFDSPGAYPIVDAMLVSSKPCSSCTEYFSLSGKQLNVGDGTTPPFRAKFTARSDKSYTPVFYLARSLDAAQRSALWVELGSMFTTSVTLANYPDCQLGQMYHVSGEGSPWFALNYQENMTDAEVAEAIQRQGGNFTYWIGR
ncbi:hypothetical protein GGR57DRAFT_495462 [Xylariaceae sp. FL1272]|nr:hypothetical protein GGR57DRAFT_495462 [Xylariaceae sp. FL1272]